MKRINSIVKNKVTFELYRAKESVLVKAFNFNNVSSEYNLPVVGLKAGIYYLVYRDGVNNKTIQVVLE